VKCRFRDAVQVQGKQISMLGSTSGYIKFVWCYIDFWRSTIYQFVCTFSNS